MIDTGEATAASPVRPSAVLLPDPLDALAAVSVVHQACATHFVLVLFI